MTEQNGLTSMTNPQCVVLAGPNGAGKTSAAPELLKDTIGVSAFVNADVIAEGLAAFRPEAVAMEAGRIMLKRLAELTESREDFAFETTLSGKSVERLLGRAIDRGYEVHVCYLWLPSADMAVARVRQRVTAGGHNVPEDVIRRRYGRSLVNLGALVMSGVMKWRIYDGSEIGPPRLIASGAVREPATVQDAARWADILRGVEEAM